MQLMSDATLQRILDNYDCGVLLLDAASGKVQQFNRRAAAMLDFCEIQSGMQLCQAIPTIYQADIRERLNSIAEGISPEALVFENSAGQRVAMNFDLRPDSPDALCFLRKAADSCELNDELAMSEWRFRTLFESMVEGVALHRMSYSQDGAAVDYIVLQVNPAYERHTGMSAASVQGHSALELYGGRIPYLDIYARVAESGAAESFEDYFAPLGRHYRVTAFSPVKGYFATVFEDISERKRMEAATAEAELKYQRLYAGMMDAFAYVDLHGRIIEFNDEFMRMLGYEAEELSRMTYLDITPAKWHQLEWEILEKQVMVRGYSDVYEKEYIRKDGTVFPIEIRTSLYTSPDGQVLGLWGIVRDVSERKRAEAERARLETQLRHSQKMEAIGQLAGGVAHDFNNILMVISGYCSMLKQDLVLDDPHNMNLDQIARAAERGAGLTSSLLAFSRKQVMNQQHVKLNDLVRNVHKFLRRIIGEDVKLRSTYSSADLEVFVDVGQMEQVLMNLAVNARDAMPAGGLFSIETQPCELDADFVCSHGYGAVGAYALLTVSDSGCGMDARIRQRIFEPFFTTKDMGRGTGLGLSIVYGIIKQHDGFINVYSEPGCGTVFKIYLPIAPATECGDLGQDVDEFAPRSGRAKILVVEDDIDLRRLMESLLGNYGYSVILACDGREALAKFAEQRAEIDLVIMDVVMPGKSGVEVCREIKLIDAAAKVLFISGYTADIIRAHGELAEDAELLVKPVKTMELLKKLDEMLGNDRG